jgi:HEPN domain-containing protein
MTPSKQERLFEKKYAEELIRIAEGDYKSARILAAAELKDIRIENAFYLCQQAIEKSLKAALVVNEIAVPLVHDLGSLLSKIPKNCEPPYGYELLDLNQYASIRRYEEGHWHPSADELRMVLEKTEIMLDWARLVIGELKK